MSITPVAMRETLPNAVSEDEEPVSVTNII